MITVPAKGYRFMAPVREEPPTTADTRPGRTSAVEPIRNGSGSRPAMGKHQVKPPSLPRNMWNSTWPSAREFTFASVRHSHGGSRDRVRCDTRSFQHISAWRTLNSSRNTQLVYSARPRILP